MSMAMAMVPPPAARDYYDAMEPADMQPLPLPADAPALPLTAVVVGCETEVGRFVVRELVRQPVFAQVYAVAEVPLALAGELELSREEAAKVCEMCVPYDAMEEGLRGVVLASLRVVAFCCLGLTKADASCPREFYRHNFDLPVRFASVVLEGEILRLSVLSYKDADMESLRASETAKVRGGMEEAIDRLWCDEYFVQMFMAKQLEPGYAFFQAPMLLSDGLTVDGEYRQLTGGAPVSRKELAKQRAALRFGLGANFALRTRDVAKAMVHEARDFILLMESGDPRMQANVRQLQRYAVEPEEIEALAEKGNEEDEKNLVLSHEQRMLRRIEAHAVTYKWGETANFDRALIRHDDEYAYAHAGPAPRTVADVPPRLGVPLVGGPPRLVAPPAPPPPMPGATPAMIFEERRRQREAEVAAMRRGEMVPFTGGGGVWTSAGAAAYSQRGMQQRRIGPGAGGGVRADSRDGRLRRGHSGRHGGGMQLIPGRGRIAAQQPYLGWHGEQLPPAYGAIENGHGMAWECPGDRGGRHVASMPTGTRRPHRPYDAGNVDGARHRRRRPERNEPRDIGNNYRPVRADQGGQHRYYDERLDDVASDPGDNDGALEGRARHPLTSGEALERAVALHREGRHRDRRPQVGAARGGAGDEDMRYRLSADREKRRPLHRTASMYSEESSEEDEAHGRRRDHERHGNHARQRHDDEGIGLGRFHGSLRQLRAEHDDPTRSIRHSLWGLAEKILGPGPRIREVSDPVVAI